MSNIWAVIRLIPEYRWRIAAILGASAALGLAGTATPYLFKMIVDTIAQLASGRLSADDAQLSVLVVVASFAVLRLAIVLFSYLQERQSDALWLNTVSTPRQRVFDNMTRLSLDYYETARVGDVMERFGTIPSITMWLFSLSEGTLASMLQLAFGVIVLLVKAPLVGLIMLALVPFNLVSSFHDVRRTKPLRRKWNQLVGKMGGLLGEMISQITTVRSFAGERIVKRRYDDVQKEWWETRSVETAIEQRAGARLNLVNTIGVVAAVAIVTWQALQGRYGVGDILFVLTLTQGLITTIQPITRLVNTTGDVDSSAERLVELLAVAPTILDAPDATTLKRIDTIEFRDVSFVYPGKTEPAVEHISFRLDAGQVLALVGPSGSGKSTLVKLLMRLYDASSGEILINDRPIHAYTQDSLRARMGVVLQDVALFNESIGDNIRFARPDADDDAVIEAARSAHADGFIRTLPEGYATKVGERGVKLSGGEKQRVAIARALLRDPQLIVLDEATSALDSESEALVQDGLERLMRGRTSVVIAHRFSTIAKADRIVVMQHGRVQETGDHASLLANRDGLYTRLHALQTSLPAKAGIHHATAAMPALAAG